jgi:hypothetical protein
MNYFKGAWARVGSRAQSDMEPPCTPPRLLEHLALSPGGPCFRSRLSKGTVSGPQGPRPTTVLSGPQFPGGAHSLALCPGWSVPLRSAVWGLFRLPLLTQGSQISSPTVPKPRDPPAEAYLLLWSGTSSGQQEHSHCPAAGPSG